jgi:hypothetical protein
MAAEPLAGRARWAIVALGIVIAAALLNIWSDWLEIDLTTRIIDGEEVPLDELDSNDNRQTVVAVLYTLSLILAAIFFIRWFHRAYSNLEALGHPVLRFGKGWAIGAWFVPILNLWRPKQIANDIWRGSSPGAASLRHEAWKEQPVSALLHIWWAAWIISIYVGNVVGRLWVNADTVEATRTAARLDLAAFVLEIPAAILAILVVRRLTARQEERMRSGGAQSPPSPATHATID